MFFLQQKMDMVLQTVFKKQLRSKSFSPKSYQNFDRPTDIRFHIDIYSSSHQCRICSLLKFRQLCDSIQTKCSDRNSIKCMVKSFSFLMELSVKDEEKFLYPFIFILYKMKTRTFLLILKGAHYPKTHYIFTNN